MLQRVEPMLDPQHAATLRSLGLDDHALQQLVASFEATGEESLEAIAAAVADADRPALLREAHKLKGCALLFSAQRVATTAAALEASTADWVSAAQLLARLESELSETVRALHLLAPIGEDQS